jgi:hypothetical protein
MVLPLYGIGVFDRGGRVVLALGIGLEHPRPGLLGHVDLPALVNLYASLVLRVEHGGVDDVHVHVLVLGVGLERPIPRPRLLVHVEYDGVDDVARHSPYPRLLMNPVFARNFAKNVLEET